MLGFGSEDLDGSGAEDDGLLLGFELSFELLSEEGPDDGDDDGAGAGVALGPEETVIVTVDP